MMNRILYPLLATLALVGNTDAASLDGDRLRVCDQRLEISAPVRPVALFDASSAALERKQFDQVYELFLKGFEATLDKAGRENPKTAAFFAGVRDPRRDASDFSIDRNLDGTEGNDLVTFDCNKKEDIAQYQIDMAAVAIMTGWVRGLERSADMQKASDFIIRQSKAHEALLFNGLPMWPWELWLNGKRLGAKDSDPLFDTQLIFLRPTAGIEIDTRSRAAGNLDASVGVEPLGFVRYSDKEYKNWWGASLLVTSTTGAGIGVGAMLRWNNYVLGITRHESNVAGTPSSNFLFVGIELYDYANKRRGDLAEWEAKHRDRIGNMLEQRQ